MTAQSSEGFFFSFGDADPEAAAVALTSSSGPSPWPQPTTPLSTFSWHTVTRRSASEPAGEQAQWLAAYPGNGDNHNTQISSSLSHGKTRPQCYQLSSPLDPRRVYSVCYQTAPEVANLNLLSGDQESGNNSNEKGINVVSGHDEPRDIIPGRYYGGLKVWSCAPDLAAYLVKHEAYWRPLLSQPHTVVAEVGCGQAMPGLAALCLGASTLLLQDYNAEVLELCVKPNVAATLAANVDSSSLSSNVQVQLVHGDWVDLQWDASAHPNGTGSSSNNNAKDYSGECDVILGSDVTFDEEACDKLACLLKRWLKPVTGVALIASKVYYFGTNGGSLEFTTCTERYGLLVEELERLDEAGGMRRVILKVTLKA